MSEEQELRNDIKPYFPYDNPRPHQAEAISNIVDTFLIDKKHDFILESPTGLGKSAVAYTVAKYLNQILTEKAVIQGKSEDVKSPNAVIATATKQLQMQYIQEFSHDSDVEFLYSAQNYECLLYPGDDEDQVYYGHPLCSKQNCEFYQQCPYLLQKEKFMNAKIGVTNYFYFFFTSELRPVMTIFDEAHTIENTVCSIASVDISVQQLYQIKNYVSFCPDVSKNLINKLDQYITKVSKLIESNPTLQSIHEFISTTDEPLNDIRKTCKTYVDKHMIQSQSSKGVPKEVKKVSTGLSRIKSLLAKFDEFELDDPEYWVLSNLDIERQFLNLKPLYVGDRFQKQISNYTEHIKYMSATICGADQFATELMIDSYNYLETPPIFPVENRLVGYKPVGKLNFKNRDQMIPKFLNEIDNLVSYYDQHNGLIHSVSYKNAYYITKNSKHKKRMYIPSKEDMLDLPSFIKEKEKKHKKGIILVSPAFLEGVSLDDDLSRFQIFLKVPFMSIGDKWVKKRMEIDPSWYARQAILKIVQGAGRSIRHENDWAYTFILDTSFERLVKQHRNLFPKWFLDSIRKVQ